MSSLPPAPSLTLRQQQLLEFLEKAHEDQGFMPSSREVQRHFGFASQTAAMDLLRALERKGFIRRLPGKARAVVLNRQLGGSKSTGPVSSTQENSLRAIPVYGTIAAGMPQDSTMESNRNLLVDPLSFGLPRNHPTFALEVRGDSMQDAHIVQGDFVIMEMREPRSGDIVAALIDGECTLKRFLTRSGTAYLKAENAAYPDLIPAQELLIQGVMVGLMRSPGGSVGTTHS